MNQQQSHRLSILAAQDEINELRVAGVEIVESRPLSGSLMGIVVEPVKLKRTFNQCGMRFWRVIAPQSHPNYQSDLSITGLKEFHIVPQFIQDEMPVVDEELIKKAWGI